MLSQFWNKYQDVVAASLVLVALVLSVAIMVVVAHGCKRDPIVVDVSNYEKVYMDQLPADAHLPVGTTPGDFGIDVSLPASPTGN